MDEKSLNDLFGFSEKPGKPPKDTGTLRNSLSFEKQQNEINIDLRASPHALKLDEWDIQKGQHCLDNSPNLQNAGVGADEAADFFGASFLLGPEMNERCVDENRQKFIQEMLNTTDFQQLHNQTKLNTLASEIATTQIGVKYAEFVAETKKEALENQKPGKNGKKKPNDPMAKEMACLSAVADAMKAAQEEVNDFNDMQKAFGCGSGAGDSGNNLDPKSLADMYSQVKNNPILKSICNLAGRYRRVAQSKQRQKVKHGYDDVVGVELSGDVHRMVSSELVRLMDPDLELDVLRRLGENAVMSREQKGADKLAKGPIVVCVDESGSMRGSKIENAKAFALAMTWIAKHQKRWIALVAYSGGQDGNILVIPPNGEQCPLAFGSKGLMNWLVHFYGRGTHMDVPLRELPTKYWEAIKAPKGKTDLILITDAICTVPKQMELNFLEWKQREKVRCITLVIGEKSAGDLTRISDELYLVNGINTTEKGVESCLSI